MFLRVEWVRKNCTEKDFFSFLDFINSIKDDYTKGTGFNLHLLRVLFLFSNHLIYLYKTCKLPLPPSHVICVYNIDHDHNIRLCYVVIGKRIYVVII